MSVIHFTFPDPPSDEPIGNLEDCETRNWQREWRSVRNILADYVQPDSTLSLDDTIDRVAQFWNQTRTNFSIAVLMVPGPLAEQIPYDHPSHKKLAEFMLALHDSGKWITATDPEERSKQQRFFWYEFIWYLRENDWRSEETVEKLEEGDDPMQFANFSAFVANLVFPEQYSTTLFYTQAKEALDDVGKLKPTFPPGVPDARVIGAAQYII